MFRYRVVLYLLLLTMLLLGVGILMAQTPTGSNVIIYLVICSDHAVVNLSGTMQVGYDVYFQIYANAQGEGGWISPLRQVSVNGVYQYSENIPYNTGTTIPAGHISSVRVSISREGAADQSIYSTTVDDLQDGCSQPQFPQSGSTPLAGTPTAVGAGTPIPPSCTPTDASTLPYILSPFGGNLNPNYVPMQGPPCSTAPWTPPRQETAGLIFVECNQFPMAEPGLVYDTDEVTLFWSWYARTEALVQDHIDNVLYSVTFFDNPLVPVPYIVQSDIEWRERNWWVFYTVPLGHLRPGHYGISYNVQWEEAISDGYDEYGPETGYERLHGDCSFNILPNTEGVAVSYTDWPRWR